MGSIRSVLLHIDASARSAVRLRVARELAVTHDAVVTAMFATYPCLIPMPYAFSDGFAPALMMQEQDSVLRARARALFEHAGKDMCWAEALDSPPVRAFVGEALYADLLVLGQNDPIADSVPGDFVESVLIGSGKPALVIPHIGETGSIGRRVLIAWKPSPEAARALTAALPLLPTADAVHLVTAEAEPAGAIERYLRRHDIDAEFHTTTAKPAEAGARLLALAGDIGADLLVMGCYGHSRARELVLGGASRAVLQGMRLPVLMSH